MPSDLLDHVNLLQGTNSAHEFSRGNTLPLVARPWGLHHWTLQTARGTNWWFHPGHRKLQGVRLTHQPSPWIGDYGSVTLLPFHGALTPSLEQQASAYLVERTLLRPHCLRAELLRYGIVLEMSPTERGALFVFTRQSSAALRLRFHFDERHSLRWEPGSPRLTGTSHNHCSGVVEPFGLHLHAEFDVAPEHYEACEQGGAVTFPASVERVELRLAGSFISGEVAAVSLARELRGKSLATVTGEGAGIWGDLLGRIRVEARDETQQRTFYSCLYRTLLFPRFLDEIDAQGNTVHYSPYDGLTHAGSLCTDNGFWDTYRTVYPFLGMYYPDKLRRMLGGWLTACREAGWTPKWVSPGLRDCMIGTHFDAVVADALARGITDWDVEGAFGFLWRDATEDSTSGAYGRKGLADYVRLGYVPCDKHPYGVSSTLDYSYDDFCVAQVARHLGKTREAEILRPRTQAYRHLFDPAVGFMRGRKADGEFEPFEEFRWGGAYIEGGPWQHVFNVPHDAAGLAALFGGNKGLCRKLDQMLSGPAHFAAGSYGTEIHEMTEMAVAGFGQYAQSNQPVHQFLALYGVARQPEKAAHWVRRVAQELYSPDDFPGDEDNGEMSAWYVLATLGVLPGCPGLPGSDLRLPPLAAKVEITGPVD